MGERFRTFDWSCHPLSAPANWANSLQTLVALMLNASQPMYIAWGEEGFLLYNDAYAVVLADKHPLALGRPIFDVWPELRDSFGQVVATVRSGIPVNSEKFQLMVRRGDTMTEAYFSFSLTPIRGEAGTVEGVFCACAESTAQVLADRRVAEETARQRRLFARAPGFITVLRGPDHVYEFVNETYLTVFGGRDFIGRPIREVFPELKGQGFYEWLDNVYATGERFVAHDVPILVRRVADMPAEQRYLDFIYEPVIDDACRTTGIFCEGFDVTEAHHAHQALIELNADLERQVAERSRERSLLWKLTPDLLGVMNERGYFESSNPAWLAVLGWTGTEVGKVTHLELVHPDDAYMTSAGFDRLSLGEPLINLVNRYRCKDGSYRWLSWTAMPEAGKFYCNGRDITTEKEAQQALDDAQSALRQAQKMEAIGQLTGGIAHDFNNLLGGVGASLQMIQVRLDREQFEGMDRYVRLGQDSVRRAAALTHRLLAFSRRQTLDPRTIDVNRLIGGMEELIRRTVGPSVELEVVGAGGLWSTKVDVSQLENSLLNLCINARDAMQPHGGRLTVETANKWFDERTAKEREVEPGQYVSICVSDTGTGMTPEVIARAFDPFYTTKPMGHGTGLGLSMVYGFVRQSGGQICIDSKLGLGTTMCMFLPGHIDEAIDEAELLTEEPIERGDGQTVLLIEDEQTIRLLVTEMLQDAGYRVIGAEDGLTGLKVLSGDSRIDLLITDVGLPGGLNGRQVADAARVKRADLKVLFVTGYADNAAVGDGHLERGMEIMTKPFEIAALANKVRRMIDQQTLVPNH